jgi:hypothetical protein
MENIILKIFHFLFSQDIYFPDQQNNFRDEQWQLKFRYDHFGFCSAREIINQIGLDSKTKCRMPLIIKITK